MDSTKVPKKNPRDSANPLNVLFFWWLKELFKKGVNSDLEESDLYGPTRKDHSEFLTNMLEKQWDKEMMKVVKMEYTTDKFGMKKLIAGRRPALHRALFRTFWVPYFITGCFVLIYACLLRTVQPIFQGWIISYFSLTKNTESATKEEALIYTVYLISSSMASIFVMHHTNLSSQQIGMRLRIACSSLIYRKMLRLSKAAMTETTSGQVINLLSNDMVRFDHLLIFLNYIWIMPFQVVLIGYIMTNKIGLSATMIGIGGLVIITVPVHTVISIMSKKLRAYTAPLTDRRVDLMNELITGIQVIKMYAWENSFSKLVKMMRTAEIKKITITSYVRAMYTAIVMFTERLTLYTTLVSYVLLGNELTAEITYVLSTYFNILQMSTALMFPQAMILYAETKISFKRIENFLMLEEVTDLDEIGGSKNKEIFSAPLKINSLVKKEGEKNKLNGKWTPANGEVEMSKPVNIEMCRVSANWEPGHLPPTICDVSLTVPSGQLCIMVGPVGSGKSSLLHVILRELPIGVGTMTFSQEDDESKLKTSQNVKFDNPNLKISYASQDAWLFGGTVRENILFGQPYERERYLEVTKVCALKRDFHQLPHGDMTIVGERGISLSGGQRARVNLARAIYQMADIYLLDDPLSAVDSKVAKHLFKKCICGYLRGKTRILVTHQLQFLQKAEQVIVLNHGRVTISGTYDTLVETNSEFNDLIDQLKTHHEKSQSITSNNTDTSSVKRRSLLKRSQSIKSTDSSSMASEEDEIDNDSDEVEAEGKAKGNLSFAVYKGYFKAGGSCFTLFLLLLFFIMTQLATTGTDYWVSYWTNLEELRRTENDMSVSAEPHAYMYNNSFLGSFLSLDEDGLLTRNAAIYIYTFCIIGCITIVLTRSFFFMKICMNASSRLHNLMFYNILQATMKFFHSNPSGRILNRFSKDIGAMDELLPKAILEAAQIMLLMCGILIMEVILNHYMIIALCLLGVVFCIARKFYLKTAQNLKRLEGVMKSPVFSHVTASMAGLTTIRSSGKSIRILLCKQFDNLQDIHTGAWYLTLACGTAFGLTLDMFAITFIACICITFILMNDGTTFGGDVGLALSQSLIMAGTLQYGVRQTVEVISQMTAVERIMQYTNLPLEGPMKSDKPPPPTWPSRGRVKFNNFSMRYNKNSPPVLKNLNISIESGWKVGVVGRTGAGKSSLISALFRLFSDGHEGQIIIDGKDTNSIGLQDLRSRISIIPQEPVLFSQTLRYNLDPFNQYEDSLLWDALHEVELSETNLDQRVMSAGENFSVGQRQLICLARAVLRNNKILVLDEATANIDPQTDSLIQRTIRTKFTACTVITIAHRLNTIIDSDRVLVMDGGRVVEFGCPYELLRDNPKGYFAQAIEKLGPDMAQNLYEQAEIACKRNNAQRSLELPSDSINDGDSTVAPSMEYNM